MRAVAQGLAAAGFATAEIHRFGRVGVVLHGREFRAFVGTVAKGLCLALAAGTPEVVFARLHIGGVGGFLGDVGGHGKVPGKKKRMENKPRIFRSTKQKQLQAHHVDTS
jgi:hypothetical protein